MWMWNVVTEQQRPLASRGQCPAYAARCNSADGGSPTQLLQRHTGDTHCALPLQGCDAAALDRDGCTPLYCAAAWNRLDTVRTLARQLGCDAKVKSGEGRTPVHVAAEQVGLAKSLTLRTWPLVFVCLWHHSRCRGERANGIVLWNASKFPFQQLRLKAHTEEQVQSIEIGEWLSRNRGGTSS